MKRQLKNNLIIYLLVYDVTSLHFMFTSFMIYVALNY